MLPKFRRFLRGVVFDGLQKPAYKTVRFRRFPLSKFIDGFMRPHLPQYRFDFVKQIGF